MHLKLPKSIFDSYKTTSNKLNKLNEKNDHISGHVGVTPILDHHYALCRRRFDNIIRDPNHKLKTLHPPENDNSHHSLRRQRQFNMPKLCTNRTSKSFIHAMSKQSGLLFYPSITHIYILYFNVF